MKLYIESLKMHLKSTLEYKTSFIVGFFSQFLVYFTYYFIIIALFNKFDNIKGFTMYEVLLTFSIIQFGFSMNELFARGIDSFDKLIIDDFNELSIFIVNVIISIYEFHINEKPIIKENCLKFLSTNNKFKRDENILWSYVIKLS